MSSVVTLKSIYNSFENYDSWPNVIMSLSLCHSSQRLRLCGGICQREGMLTPGCGSRYRVVRREWHSGKHVQSMCVRAVFMDTQMGHCDVRVCVSLCVSSVCGCRAQIHPAADNVPPLLLLFI